MTSNISRVKFSISEGLIEIEGTEAFVSSQLNFFEPFMTKILSSNSTQVNKKTVLNNHQPEQQNSNSDFAEYENVFAMADGKIQILKDIPGGNKSHKTINAALLIALANDLNGIKTTTYDAVRALCSAHAFLDSTNFSSALKGAKAHFIISGSTGSQSITLTVPGRKKAIEIANSLKA